MSTSRSGWRRISPGSTGWRRWGARILPNHGGEARIAAGGFGPGLIDATRAYVRRLLRCREDAGLAALPLRAFIAEELADGVVEYFAPYKAVHAGNVAKVIAAGR